MVGGLWRHWSSLLPFVAHLQEWAEREDSLKATPYLLSSRARVLMERYHAAYSCNRILTPEPDEPPGEAYPQAFEETLGKFAAWMQANA